MIGCRLFGVLQCSLNDLRLGRFSLNMGVSAWKARHDRQLNLTWVIWRTLRHKAMFQGAVKWNRNGNRYVRPCEWRRRGCLICQRSLSKKPACVHSCPHRPWNENVDSTSQSLSYLFLVISLFIDSLQLSLLEVLYFGGWGVGLGVGVGGEGYKSRTSSIILQENARTAVNPAPDQD